MASRTRLLPWTLAAREKRLLYYLALLLPVAAWRFVPRPWNPSTKLETAHYTILSSASPEQTAQTGRTIELLYSTYSNRFSRLPSYLQDQRKLRVKLFKDRREFRKINPGLGWGEAFYREPYCRAYFAGEEANPYHWMLHEAVHQLNHEVARLELKKWLDEGLAAYFSTGRIVGEKLDLGRVDLNTYPAWWIEEIATTPDLAENIRNRSVIPLRAIVTNHGGPWMNRKFNLYYLHWWTLTRFLLETPKYRDGAFALIQRGGSLSAFEQCVGPVEQVEGEWHEYVRGLKRSL